MSSYLAYGLGIRSALPLPGLSPGEVDADVIVRLGKVGSLPENGDVNGSYFRTTATETYLFWEEVGRFLVRAGQEIIVDPAPGVKEDVIQFFILGPAMGVLLHQRGFLVLHSSAVAVSRNAVAFLGKEGSGKSTLAAALNAGGHAGLTDDVTAVHFDAERPMVFPGFPLLKLDAELVASLAHNLHNYPGVKPSMEKQVVRVTGDFPRSPIPLRRLYVLAEGNDHSIESLQIQDAFVELIRHSYCVRLLPTIGSSVHLFQCANLVNNVTICRLRIHRSFSRIPRLVQMVEEDLVGET
ncbi:MAG: serine kinase [Candidatus Neomarinimicrobiota bacterium]